MDEIIERPNLGVWSPRLSIAFHAEPEKPASESVISVVFRALLSFAPVIIPSVVARFRSSDATKPKRQIIGSYARQELDGLFCLRVKICHRTKPHTISNPPSELVSVAQNIFGRGKKEEGEKMCLVVCCSVLAALHAATKTCSDIAHANIRPPPPSRRRWRLRQRQRHCRGGEQRRSTN